MGRKQLRPEIIVVRQEKMSRSQINRVLNNLILVRKVDIKKFPGASDRSKAEISVLQIFRDDLIDELPKINQSKSISVDVGVTLAGSVSRLIRNTLDIYQDNPDKIADIIRSSISMVLEVADGLFSKDQSRATVYEAFLRFVYFSK